MHQKLVEAAKEIAAKVAGPTARQHDREGTFCAEAVAAFAEKGLLALAVPRELGGAGLGPRALADVAAILAEADASAAMVFLMHTLGTMCLAAGPRSAAVRTALEEIAGGRHLTTLAFSEVGSRSHFWAPVSRAAPAGAVVRITARKSFVTSAGHAQSYVVATLASGGKAATDSTLYLVRASQPGVQVGPPWDGMGLRANASAPMTLEGVEVSDELRLCDDGAGFKALLEVVLPAFNVGSAAVALGLCRATVGATISHLKTAQFEHLGATLGEALPTLRALLAGMQIETDGLAARVEDCLLALESPGPATMLKVLEVKAGAGESALQVVCDAMHVCGGAAFARQTQIERYFRDAHAGAVMAPTVDVLKELMGRALLGMPLF